jgi:hypothetical protein
MEKKARQNYKCTICLFVCSKPSDFQRHCSTRKHAHRTAFTEKNADLSSQRILFEKPHSCTFCGKAYSAKNSLWYHSKKCTMTQNVKPRDFVEILENRVFQETNDFGENEPQELGEYNNQETEETHQYQENRENEVYEDNETFPEILENENIKMEQSEDLEENDIFSSDMNAQIIQLLKHVLKKNAELSSQVTQLKTDVKLDVKDQLSEQLAHFASTLQPSVTNHHTNHNNTQFNMNFFLNEQCKDAVNVSDFIESLQLTLEDLKMVVEKGFIMGNYQIIKDKFNELGVYRRPIHCSDLKRETIYVRENNEWQKEPPEHPTLQKLVNYVAHKVCIQSNIWHKENPDFMQTQEKKDQSLLIMNSVLGGANGKPIYENKARIAKNLMEFVEIDKKRYRM